MTRLDMELVNRNIFSSRARAQMEVKNNKVLVNNKIINKCSYNIQETDEIRIKEGTLKYVSRGGLKLEKALTVFKIDLTNKILLDIGSSTGGFTDCALNNNIKEVIDIDVGKNQLDSKIRKNPNVKVFEETDIRNFNDELLNYVDIISIDISFISVTKIIPKLSEITNAREIICLIKPQFECGKEIADKYKGIILNKEVHKDIIINLVSSFKNIGYNLNGITYSPIKGGNGNIEYLAYFTKDIINYTFNYNEVVKEAFESLKYIKN